MAVTEAAARSSTDGKAWRGRAFGLTLEAAGPMPGIVEDGRDAARGRRAAWRLLPREERAREVSATWSRLVDRRHPGGRPFMTIDRDDALGYRVWSPGHGRHLVSPDGRTISSSAPGFGGASGWERLFLAQPLPLAAALQGLELFHASAVALAGRGIGLVAPSGTGKTSVAAQLVAAGAAFVTDDVLALEPDGERVLAHPGPGRLAIDDGEFASLSDEARARLGRPVGRSDKLQLEPAPAAEPVPLGLLYFLRRRPDESQLRIEERTEAAARSLLGSGFLGYLRTPEQLLKHLDVCSRIAAAAASFDVAIPLAADSRAVAAAVRAHAEDVL